MNEFTLDGAPLWVAADTEGALGLFDPNHLGPRPPAPGGPLVSLERILLLRGPEGLPVLDESAPWERFDPDVKAHPSMRHAWSGEDIVIYPRFTDPMCFFKEELDRGWAWVEATAPDPDCVLLSSAARAANVRLHQADGCERCFPLWPLILQLYEATARQVGFYGYMYERHPFDAYLRLYSPKGRPFSLLDVPPTLRDGVRRLNTSFATHERLHVEGPEGRR